jgi:hypothetical protein
MHPVYTDEGSFLKSVLSISPQSIGSATATGAGVAQISGPGYYYNSAQLIVFVGAITGTPGTISIASQLQDSPDGSTLWANFGAAMPLLAGAAAAANTSVAQNVQTRGCRGFLRLVAVVTLVTFTAVLVGGIIVLGGASEDPAI